MAKYDFEQFLTEFKDRIKDVLNTKITAINTEKGDSLLLTVPDNNYFFRKDAPTHKACNVFFYYEPNADISTEGQSFQYAKRYVLEVGIAFKENGRYADTNEDHFRRILRYQRALEESIVDIFSKVRGYSNCSILGIKSSKEERDENQLHIAAFEIEITIGGA